MKYILFIIIFVLILCASCAGRRYIEKSNAYIEGWNLAIDIWNTTERCPELSDIPNHLLRKYRFEIEEGFLDAVREIKEGEKLK